MHSSRVTRSLLQTASALLALCMFDAVAPCRASAGQIRLGMSGTTPTIEFLQDVTMTLKAGAPNQTVEFAIGVSFPNVLSDTTLGYALVTPTPSLFLDYQFTPSTSLKHVDGRYAYIGNESSVSSPDFNVYTLGSRGFIYGTFQPGGFFTFFQGLYEFPNNLAGTSPWVTTPSTITLSPENFFFKGETSTTTLSSANWELTSSGPGPSSVPEIDPAGLGSVLAIVSSVLGLIERRRRDNSA